MTWSRNYMDPFGEDEKKVKTRNLKEHSDLWFWWREQTFLQNFIEWCALMWSAFSFLFLIIGIVGGIVWAVLATETSSWDYNDLPEWAEEQPSMKGDIQEALEDNVLTSWEHWMLERQYYDLDKQNRIDEVKEAIE